MGDPTIFLNFLTNVAGFTNAWPRNEFLQFADTFQALLGTSEKELDSFVKNTHSANSARANNQKILIPPGSVITLKALLFELKDRDLCDSLPNAAMLDALDPAQVAILQTQRTQAIQDQLEIDNTNLTSMDVPKLTTSNYETFMTSFTALCARSKASDGTTLAYLMRTTTDNYDAPGWASRSACLKACVHLNGACFIRDREALFSLFIEHVGTKGIGLDIVNRFKATKNGYSCYHAFNAHFHNASFLENKATSATTSMNNAVYKGDRQNFTLEIYYSIMAKAFNDLETADPAHSLSEQQKITKFDQGLKDPTAINWAITAKNQWNTFAPGNQTFDSYYNKFSQFMTKFKTLSSPPTRTSRLAPMSSGRGRGRG